MKLPDTKLITIFAIPLVLLGWHSNTYSQQKTLEMVVHRGANHLAPENTWSSTLKCIELGVDYVEVDVRMSKDSVFYVIHDETVDRTTNGSGSLHEKFSWEIEQLDAGSWFHEDFEGERVPRLDSLLSEIKGKIKVYFDVKAGDIKKLIELVYQTGFENHSFFWFQDFMTTRRFRSIDQELALKINAHNPTEVREALEYQPDIIECQLEDLTTQFISVCKQNDLKIMLYEKDSKKNYQRALNSAADMINLNRPELMIQLIQKQSDLHLNNR